MSEHRWQGYSHQELFDQIHQGPGPDGSTAPVRRWAELSRALGEIDAGLASALASAMADWQGEAAENARGSLRPLGEWAVQAQQAAELMRERVERQAEFVSKARTDMPPPVPVTAENPGAAKSMLIHLFGGQSDYEAQEAEQNAAEQRAFEVMRTYESSTSANTTSLASFTPPPRVVVDAPPAGTGGPGASGQGGITLSWGTPGPLTRFSVHSGQNWVNPASAALGRTSAPSSGAPGSTGSASGSRGTTGSASRAQRGMRTERRDQVDRSVTEQVGDPDGFFDEVRTLARPVIGGDPG